MKTQRDVEIAELVRLNKRYPNAIKKAVAIEAMKEAKKHFTEEQIKLICPGRWIKVEYEDGCINMVVIETDLETCTFDAFDPGKFGDDIYEIDTMVELSRIKIIGKHILDFDNGLEDETGE